MAEDDEARSGMHTHEVRTPKVYVPDIHELQETPDPNRKLIRFLLILAAAACIFGLGWVYFPHILHTIGEKRAAAKTETQAGFDAEAPVTEEIQTETETEALLNFSPHAVDSTQPSNLIQTTGIQVDGTQLQDQSAYSPDSLIDFGPGDEYTAGDGIYTFRGDNFRNSPSFGHADIKKGTITPKWTRQTGGLTFSGASWTGSGWTGQPLMRKWTRSQKKNMAMADWAKKDDNLVEVIYACMDGYVYFLDLDSGKQTRDPLNLGWTFKGSGALDPRGYPILYVGAGYDSNNGTARAFIVNLVDMSIMYEFGALDDYSLRGRLSYFDSSPLVDAETDTLIWPGENGILYLIHLNTAFNKQTGMVCVNPGRVVKWHYYGTRSSSGSFWIGMEDSCAIFGGYLFVADNGGNLMCMNLNTLQLVWVQDTLDDSNSTPVLANENGRLYLYVSTSFRLGWRSSATAAVPIWKINAETGEVIWHRDYECYTQDGVSGGVQSTLAVGKQSLSDYLYATVAMTGSPSDGVIVCLKRDTGEVVWEQKSYYAWSSPVCVYNADGTGNVIYCACNGRMYLLDGLDGTVRDTFELSSGAIEASPAVWNNEVVIGTRASKIWGLELG